MPAYEFFVFRHGETAWNLESRFQGHTDIPLNHTGRRQAHRLAPKIAALNLDIILSSDLVRARETAEIVAVPTATKIVETPQLREAKIGAPEGMLRKDVIQVYGADHWARWLSVKKEDLDFNYPNGESKRDQLTRVVSYLESFAAQHPQFRRVGVSTHGGVVRRLIHFTEGAPTEPVPLPNCVLYRVTYDSDQRKWSFGE